MDKSKKPLLQIMELWTQRCGLRAAFVLLHFSKRHVFMSFLHCLHVFWFQVHELEKLNEFFERIPGLHMNVSFRSMDELPQKNLQSLMFISVRTL
jgi:hypothetical protein